MRRLRPRAGLLLLAFLLLGIASSAAAALPGTGCCAGMAAMGGADPAAPCHSLAPSSCCEERVPGSAAAAPGGPALASVIAAAPAACAPPALAALAPWAPRAAARAHASVVLRL
jgi:hypothetical protein